MNPLDMLRWIKELRSPQRAGDFDALTIYATDALYHSRWFYVDNCLLQITRRDGFERWANAQVYQVEGIDSPETLAAAFDMAAKVLPSSESPAP